MNPLFRMALLAMALPLATAAQADNKLSCAMTQACTSQDNCTEADEPVVISFCETKSSIQVAAKGGKITLLNRIMDEGAYKTRPYKVLKGRRLDVGQWAYPDMAAGEPNLITFIMHEDAPVAVMFRGDPLKQRGLGYLKGSCTQKRVSKCRANK